MGVGVSTAGSSVGAAESYLTELPDSVFDHTLATTRMLKVSRP